MMALWGWNGDEKWSFVIDTDQYAGNFERELCAYVIGKVDWSFANTPYDTCGGPYLRMFDESCLLPLGELSDTRIADRGDDGITRAPCDLAPTPGWSNDGYGKQYKVQPNSKYGFKHPAYNSVAIFLRRKPSDEELAELIKRALEFPTVVKLHEWDSSPTILGCRLVKETVVVETTPALEPRAMTIAVYAGSFDPVTLGHLDLIARASRRFSQLIVAVGENSAKQTLFDAEERVALIEAALKWDCYGGSVSVKSFSGMLVDFCQREQATVIVRGLRAITDFENEMAIAHTNDTLAGIDTVFFPTRCRHSFVASSIVKEIAIHNTATGWAALSQYCPENVIEALRKKYDKTWTDQQESK